MDKDRCPERESTKEASTFGALAFRNMFAVDREKDLPYLLYRQQGEAEVGERVDPGRKSWDSRCRRTTAGGTATR